MFLGLKNAIYLNFWAGKKKAGPHKELVITRSCESYGGHVFDLLWSIKFRGSKKSSKHLSIRANSWDLIEKIKHIENTRLQKAIKEVIQEHNSVKKS